jgi:hypothetical protein
MYRENLQKNPRLGKNPRTNKKSVSQIQTERESQVGLPYVHNSRYGEPCKSTFVCLPMSLLHCNLMSGAEYAISPALEHNTPIYNQRKCLIYNAIPNISAS